MILTTREIFYTKKIPDSGLNEYRIAGLNLIIWRTISNYHIGTWCNQELGRLTLDF
jgi:hypothetical protein